jgi:hypothetical protein
VGGAAAPPSTLRYPLQDCGGRVPRFVEGTELIGKYQASGPGASYILRRADAQVTAWLLYLLASSLDGAERPVRSAALLDMT